MLWKLQISHKTHKVRETLYIILNAGFTNNILCNDMNSYIQTEY